MVYFVLIFMFLLVPAASTLAQEYFDFSDIQAKVVDDKNVEISWRTSLSSKGRVKFGLSADNLNAYIEDSGSAATYHQVELGNLKPEKKYYYQITAWNSSGEIYSFVDTFETKKEIDTDAPLVSEVRVAYVSGTAAVIEWKTDEPADSVVKFGEFQNYNQTASNGSRVTNHMLVLRNLKTNTSYNAHIYSTDDHNNRSSEHSASFTTLTSNTMDNAALAISELRPSSPTDSQITADSLTVSFRASRFAKSRITLTASGFTSQTINLQYGTDHRATFFNLPKSTTFKISIQVTDIFNKTLNREFYASTLAAANPSSPSGSSSAAPLETTDLKPDGVYARVVITGTKTTGNGNFGSRVYLGSDSSYVESGSWFALLENSQPVIDPDVADHPGLPGVLVERKQNEIRLELFGPNSGKDMVNAAGYIEFYNATITNLRDDPANPLENGFDKTGAGSYSTTDDEVWQENNRSYFWMTADVGNDGYYTGWQTGGGYATGASTGSGSGAGSGTVILGAEYSRYTAASALLKTPDSPDVYAIMNGQAHYISSPASFNEYGYRWQDIRTVSASELAKYPPARLIKEPDSAAIYYLYQRPEDQWLKILLNSPTVFVSYPDNYWGNVITVTRLDVDSYPDVKLIKTEDNQAVWYLDDNTRHFISAAVFKAHGFNKFEVATVSQAHLDSYLVGENLQ